MDKGQIILRKIPVDRLINLLVEMYNRGVDYIDISGVQEEEQDKMAISFTEDYLTEEAKKEFSAIDPIDLSDELLNTKLSDEDLNDLV